jgi:hypothetical protein
MEYKTLGHLRKVNFGDKELFIEYLSQRLSILNESYTVVPISNINFSYIIKEGLATDLDRRLLQDIDNKSLAFHSFNNMNLPVSMNPSDYGQIIASQIFDTFTRYIATRGTKTFQIDVYLDKLVNKVTILGAINLEWIDTTSTNNLGNVYTFKREIKKSTIYFVDGEVVLRKQMLNAKPYNHLKPESKVINDFYTLDIETVKQSNNKLKPYLICAYNGKDYITSYNDNPVALYNSFFEQLLSKIKPGLTIIYAHNFSSFDGIFLMKNLFQLGEVTPLIDDNRIITIKVKIGEKRSEMKTIIFKDSYLLLPLPLRALCTTFGVESPKSYFPFNLTKLFYIGVFPQFKYWTGITFSEWETLKLPFKNTFWDFQIEATKYCKLDCSVLHQILIKFNELIFKEFQINTDKPLTLPSLAMKIYQTHFMPENSIYQILGKPESFIRESYTGGAVDVYIPHNRITGFFGNIKAKFIKLYYYDFNSLYPTVMANHPMPIGKPIVFEGDIRKIEPNAYGFFYCNITSPTNLNHPILQRRIKTENGLRTIAGLGSWEGWICSTEMDNAIRFGYTFEILKGYQFETGDLFSGYVKRMYELRLQYPKGDAMNLIAKLLMNSLYGKFGMKLNRKDISIYNCSTDEGRTHFKEMLNIFGQTVEDYVKIGDNFLIIRDSFADVKYNEGLDMFHGQNINVAIASAITAGGRVEMSILKNNPDFNLYYSDTDSVVIDAPLPDNLIGSGLGKLKLEHTINRAVFLAPKVYGLVDTDGNEIIKIKGIKSEVASKLSIQELESLLIKQEERLLTQEKWFKI